MGCDDRKVLFSPRLDGKAVNAEVWHVHRARKTSTGAACRHNLQLFDVGIGRNYVRSLKAAAPSATAGRYMLASTCGLRTARCIRPPAHLSAPRVCHLSPARRPVRPRRSCTEAHLETLPASLVASYLWAAGRLRMWLPTRWRELLLRRADAALPEMRGRELAMCMSGLMWLRCAQMAGGSVMLCDDPTRTQPARNPPAPGRLGGWRSLLLDITTTPDSSSHFK